MNILLIENDGDTADAITEFLLDLGHKVVSYTDGFDPNTYTPDVILSDHYYREHDAKPILAKLKAICKCRIILLSSWYKLDPEVDMDTCVDLLMKKPFCLDELEKYLNNQK